MKRMTRIVYPTVVSIIFGCFALIPPAQAVLPPPDGSYGPPDYGTGNTAEGEDALFNLSSGVFNTATGFRALGSVTTGRFNTAIGAGALFNNTGDDNTAVGSGALLSNTTGAGNTAAGESALFNNTTGNQNTAAGESALSNNTSGSANTATGSGALRNNISGRRNTAVGESALSSNSSGSKNTATGSGALLNNTIGDDNTAAGDGALFSNGPGAATPPPVLVCSSKTPSVSKTRPMDSTPCSATPAAALTRRSVTEHSLTTPPAASTLHWALEQGKTLLQGTNNIDIGNPGVGGEANTIRIGGNVGLGTQTATFIAGIHGMTTGNNNAIPVVIDSAGQLGTVSSSRRYKTEIKPMDKASESILALKPVSFRYKIHKDTTPQFGLIAEEVAKVNPDLVIYDSDAKLYTVRYDAVNAMLLNEFERAHGVCRGAAQSAGAGRDHCTFGSSRIEALTAGLQKVNVQLELTKSAPQTVLNNQ